MRWRGMGWRGGCLAGTERKSPRPHVLFAFAAGWGVWRRGPLLPLRRAEGGRGGGPLSLQAVLWRGRSRPVPAGAVWACAGPSFGHSFAAARRGEGAAVSALHGGGKERLFRRPSFPPGFPGIFVLLSRGRFARRGETDANSFLAGGMMGELGPLSGGMRCPFARRESVWAEGRGCRAGSWPAVRGGPGAVPTGGKGPVGDGGGERRSGTAAAGSSAAGGRCRRRLGGGRFAPTVRRRGGRRIAYGKRDGGLL